MYHIIQKIPSWVWYICLICLLFLGLGTGFGTGLSKGLDIGAGLGAGFETCLGRGSGACLGVGLLASLWIVFEKFTKQVLQQVMEHAFEAVFD